MGKQQVMTPGQRQAAWVAAVRGREIRMDGAGWHAARLNGILILRRPDLGDLMDALEAPGTAAP